MQHVESTGLCGVNSALEYALRMQAHMCFHLKGIGQH